MKTKSESELEQAHWRRARLFGFFIDKIMRTSMNSFPDHFYARAKDEDVCRHCGRGRIVLMEWKREGEEATAQQQLRHRQLREAGVEVFVVDSIEQANRILGI